MAELKTDYKDQLLDSLVNTKRVYNLVDADGNVVRENVSLEDVTVYSQDGDNFGAADINKTNEMVNQVNRNLLFPDGTKFYPDIQDGKYGFNTDPNRGADTFSPFSSGVEVVLYPTATQSYTFTKDYELITVFYMNNDFSFTYNGTGTRLGVYRGSEGGACCSYSNVHAGETVSNSDGNNHMAIISGVSLF